VKYTSTSSLPGSCVNTLICADASKQLARGGGVLVLREFVTVQPLNFENVQCLIEAEWSCVLCW